jgi:hypothetical protein
MALVAIRISMPDRTGKLAAVASSVSDASADIVTIDVVFRGDGLVVDDLCVDTGALSPSELRRRIEAVPGVVVEAVRSVNEPPSPAAALELAAALVEDPAAGIDDLVEGLPAAIGAEWAMALALRDERVELLHASARAPGPPEGPVPWLPLERPRRLAVAPWMPTSWRLRSMMGGLELAVSPLGDSTAAVAVARTCGRFRPPELRQLEILASFALRQVRASNAAG